MLVVQIRFILRISVKLMSRHSNFMPKHCLVLVSRHQDNLWQYGRLQIKIRKKFEKNSKKSTLIQRVPPERNKEFT